jgi:hypothetical protein
MRKSENYFRTTTTTTKKKKKKKKKKSRGRLELAPFRACLRG